LRALRKPFACLAVKKPFSPQKKQKISKFEKGTIEKSLCGLCG
jgi:hypothetical protein